MAIPSHYRPNTELEQAQRSAEYRFGAGKLEVLAVMELHNEPSIELVAKSWHNDLANILLYRYNRYSVNGDWAEVGTSAYGFRIGPAPASYTAYPIGQLPPPNPGTFTTHKIYVNYLPNSPVVVAIIGVHSNGYWRTSSQVHGGPAYQPGPGNYAGAQNAASQYSANYAAFAQNASQAGLSNNTLLTTFNQYKQAMTNTFCDWAQVRAEFYKKAPNQTKFGEIIGWRAWRVVGNDLRSMYIYKAWPPQKEMTGDPSDTYGVHAWKTKEQAERYIEEEYAEQHVVIGQIALWGEVIEHEKGYRASNAKIKSLELELNRRDAAFPTSASIEELRARYCPLNQPK